MDTLVTSPNQQHITIQEAARILNRSEWSIGRYLREGKLTRIYVGNGVFIDRAQVEALAKELDGKRQKGGGDDTDD